MTDVPLRYAVLLARPEQLRLEDVAKVLAEFRAIPFHDAARLARPSWGFVAEDLDAEAAGRLKSLLASAGLEGISLPLGLIEETPEPFLASRGELDREGFKLFAKSGETETISWARLALIAAAGCPRARPAGPAKGAPSSPRMIHVPGLPVPPGMAHIPAPGPRETVDLVMTLDLYQRKPSRRARLEAEGFDYSCLKARMGYNALSNFRALLQEAERLAGTRRGPARAPLANRGARILLEGLPVAGMGYDTLEDLDRECRWLLTLESLRDP